MEKAVKKKNRWWLWAIFIFMIAWFMGWVPGCGETPEQEAKRLQREAELAAQNAAIEAFVMSQTFVKRQLRSPATAKFPSILEADVRDLGDGRFFVSAYVDAENAFGALIRTHYKATLRRIDDERWQAESVELIE